MSPLHATSKASESTPGNERLSTWGKVRDALREEGEVSFLLSLAEEESPYSRTWFAAGIRGDANYGTSLREHVTN